MTERPWRRRWAEKIRWLMGRSKPSEPGVSAAKKHNVEFERVTTPQHVLDLAEGYRPEFNFAEQHMSNAKIRLAGLSRSSGWHVTSLKLETTRQAEKESVARFDLRDLPSAFSSRIQIETAKIDFYRAHIEKNALQIQFLNQVGRALLGAKDRIVFLQREIAFFSKEIENHQKIINHFESGFSIIADIQNYQDSVSYFSKEEDIQKDLLRMEPSSGKFAVRKKIKDAIIARLESQKKVYEKELRLYKLYHVTFVGRRNGEEIHDLIAGVSKRIEKIRRSTMR
jgi:hypothetical protein